MILITTLGTGKYEPTRYEWNTGETVHTKETAIFPEAVVEWRKPQKTFVLLTEEAENSENWETLKHAIQDKTQLEPVRIPAGKNSDELWELFVRMDQCVQDNDEVVIDITHGFRSLPLIALLAVAYLKQVKQAKIQHILYGAFEARSEGITPVFDLTPFAEILDWLTAAKIFIATGDSRELGKLLESIQNKAYRQSQNAGTLPVKLKSIASSLEKVSANLLSAQVLSLPENVEKLASVIQEGEAEIKGWSKPLVPLLEKVKQAYLPFHNNDLETQRELIRWYLDRGHVVQALTLMREWIVSYECELNGRDWKDLKTRQQVEESLSEKEHQTREDREGYPRHIDLWGRVTQLRNRVAHCGFGKDPLEGTRIVDQARDLYREIKDLTIPQNDGTD